MNKLNILFLGSLIGMGMVACDEQLPFAPPQANEQGPVLEGFAGAYATFSESSVNLPTTAEEGEYLALYTVNAGDSGLPQAEIWGELEVSGTSDFAESIVLGDVDNMVGTVSLADLCDAHTQFFGISPSVKTMYYRVLLYANVEGNSYRIGGADYYGATGSYSETYDPGYVIEESYYIIGVEGWNPEDAVLMTHSDESAYDDPVFTYSFSAEGDTYWKIVPPDVYAEVGQAGFNPDSDFWPLLYYGTPYEGSESSGTLEIGDKDAAKIPAGSWTLSVNMKDLTYWYEGTPAGLPDWIGTPNTYQDWNIDTSMRLMPYGDDYKGFSYFGGEWGGKLAYSIGDNQIWLGQQGGTEVEENGDSSNPTFGIQLSDDGGNIFEGVDPKLYSIKYNFSGKYATFYEIIAVSMIGVNGDWDNDINMSPVEGSNDLKWSITYTFDNDTEFKFRFNSSWDVNLGGDLTDLTYDGSNISVTAGTYVITLDITNVPYTCTMTANRS